MFFVLANDVLVYAWKSDSAGGSASPKTMGKDGRRSRDSFPIAYGERDPPHGGSLGGTAIEAKAQMVAILEMSIFDMGINVLISGVVGWKD